MSKPEPEWWAEAQALRASDPTWTIDALMAHFKKSRSTIRDALNPELRARHRVASRRWWAKQSGEKRIRRNLRRRLAYARQQRKKWEERENLLDTSDQVPYTGASNQDSDHHQ